MSQVSSQQSILGSIKDFLKLATPQGRAEYDKQLIKKAKKDLVTKNLGQQLLYNTYGYTDTYAFHPKDIYRPRDRLSYRRRDQLYIDCGILRVTIDKVTKEINRNGVGMQKEFVRKCRREHIEPCLNPIHEKLHDRGESPIYKECDLCPNPDVPLGQDGCEEEYSTEQIRCTECYFPTRPPKIMQKRKLRRLLRGYVNNDNQTLLQVYTHVGIDVEKHDNGYIISKYIYTYENKEDIKPSSKTWVQTYRGNPSRIRPVISKLGDLGSKAFTCIKHRDQFIEISKEEERQREGVLRCDRDINQNLVNKKTVVCGEPMQRVYYVNIREEGSNADVKYCYIKGEVQHIRKYFPAGAMGISLIDSLYYPILQVIGQEKWMAEYYLKMRMFKSFISAPQSLGGTGESVQDMFRAEFTKWRQDPYYVPIFGVPADAKQGIEHHRLDDSPQELQFIENRQENRQQIANAYGMSNVWMNDTSTGAGLNNEGIEMAVTNRHIEWGQRVIDEQGSKPLCANILNIDIQDLEYYIGYNSHEEQDLMAEKQRKALEIANARAAQELGANVTINADGDFVYSAPVEGEPLVPMQMQVQNKQSYQDVQGVGEEGLPYERRSQSKPMQGAPNEPRVSGSGITTKMLKSGDMLAYLMSLPKDERDRIIEEAKLRENGKGNGKHQKKNIMYEVPMDGYEKETGAVTSTTPGAYSPVHSPRDEEEEEEEEKVLKYNIDEIIIKAGKFYYMGGVLLCEEHKHAFDKPSTKYTNDMYVCNYPGCTKKMDSEEKKKSINKADTDKKVTWKDQYKTDWENSHKYELDTFRTILIDNIHIPDNYGVTLPALSTTVNNVIEEPKGLPALVVYIHDGDYTLLDGFKRLFAVRELGEKYVRVAVVKPKAIAKRKDPEFEQKHPRDEEGKFKPKPNQDSNDDNGGGDGDDFATQQFGSDNVEATNVSPPTVASKLPEGPKGDKPIVDMTPMGGLDLLEHAKKFYGFIITPDMSYYPGGGNWVGTPTKIYSYSMSRLDENKLEGEIKTIIDIISSLPESINYVVSAWVDDNYLFITIGEIWEDAQQALKNAKLNGELEFWSFDENKAITTNLTKTKEIIYDFFKRRHNYHKQIPYLSYDEYLSIKGVEMVEA